MNRKGIEGLPLKYLVLVVASVLATILIITTYNSLGADIKNATSFLGEYVRNLTMNLTK